MSSLSSGKMPSDDADANTPPAKKRARIVLAVDITAPEPSDDEPENLSPIKTIDNPYRKKSSPTPSSSAKQVSSESTASLSTTCTNGASTSITSSSSTAAPAGKTTYQNVVDITLPEASNDAPEMLQPEAVAIKKQPPADDAGSKNASASSSAAGKQGTPSKAASTKKESNQSSKKSMSKSCKKSSSSSSDIPGPIRPRPVPALRSNPFDRSGPRWSTYNFTLLIRTAPPSKAPPPGAPRTKVAAFDMDGTLLLTLYVKFASNLSDYELWSKSIIDKLRSLHDDDGYKLLIITNQGGIRTNLDGKIANQIRAAIDWLAFTVDRPLNAIASCSKTNGLHKPNPGMWSIAEQKFNGGQEFDLAQSFFVGDSADPNDGQGGTDIGFANNVGEMRDGTLKFYKPEEYFGPSDYERRCEAKAARIDAEKYEAPPREALRVRAALSGGYLSDGHGPIMLILVGVQGSGKSTFCSALMEQASNGKEDWVHLSQDTINGGKPGKREAVEKAALENLQSTTTSGGKSVIIDRMHLSVDQRAYFVKVASEANVPCHVLWFDVPKSVVERRVRSRTGHAGGVEGESGAKLAARSLAQLVPPSYEEGIDLISRVRTEEEVLSIASTYGRVAAVDNRATSTTTLISQEFALKTNCGEEKVKLTIPSVALGTMSMGKRVAGDQVASALRAGFRAVDTAPTYNNENEVGRGLSQGKEKPYVIVKVPKRAVTADDARSEVLSSLDRLGLSKADLIILHWPCDFIDSKTLGSVWQELEAMVSEGLCEAIGVSNFSVGALRVLLPLCRTSYPAVNQVERHPLLPQWDLADYCHTHGIVLQAHTALGQGKDELLKHPAIVSIAQEYSLSVPDMLLRWNLSHGVAIVTKCSSYERQKAAASQKQRLPASVMKKLDTIGYDVAPHRLINVPFMYRPGAPYSWGNRWQK